MKNIEYLEEFYKKHHLTGRVKVKYTGTLEKDDDYMSEITIGENKMSINDIIFDIISGFPPDVAQQWMIENKESGISFVDWLQSNNSYIPKIDTKSIDAYHKEMEDIISHMKDELNKVLEP